MKSAEIITDDQILVSARTEFGNPIPVHDEGFGTLFVHRGSMGVLGIVRAMTWEDAYSACEDVFLPSTTESHDEWVAAYGEDYTENAEWAESYGFRPNGRNFMPGDAGIYQKDLNGDRLDVLTPDLLERLGITLEIESPAEDEPPARWFAWHTSIHPNPNGQRVLSFQGRHGTWSRVLPRTSARHATPHTHFSPDYDVHAAAW